MADDSDSLVLSISADVRQVKRALDRLVVDSNTAANGISNAFKGTNTATNAIIQNISKVDAAMAASAKRTQGLSAQFKGGLGGLGIGLGAGFAVQAGRDILDANVKITNSLKVTGLAGTALDKTFNDLGNTALKFGASFESLAGVFSRVSIVQKELGVTSEQLTRFSDNVGAALKVQGTSAQDAQGPLLQLSQLLSTGTVRAEEFNSVNEGLPIVLRTVAEGLYGAGAGIQDLRKAMLTQSLTSKQFFEGFEKGSVALQQRAELAGATISQSFENVRTALILAVNEFDSSTHASAELANAIGTLIKQTRDFASAFREVTGLSLGETLATAAKRALNPTVTLRDAVTVSGELANRFVGDQSKMGKAVDDTSVEVEKLRAHLASVGQGAELAHFNRLWDGVVKGAKDGTLSIEQLTVAQIELNRAFRSADTGDTSFAGVQAGVASVTKALEDASGKVKETDSAVEAFAKHIIELLGTNLTQLGDSVSGVFAKVAAAITNISPLIDAMQAKIREAQGDLERMNREIADGAKLGQIGPVFSGGGSFLNEEQLQRFKAGEAGLAAFNEQAAKSIELIKQREGFLATAKWDVNAFRVGFGSDTITDEMGKVSKVVKGTTTDLAGANRDLSRRVQEFQTGIQSAIGPETWKSLSENQQAALTSIAYNYGSLPSRIVAAIKAGGGPDVVAKAINDLGTDNGGMNKERRTQEAELFGGAAFTAPSTRQPKKTPGEIFTKDTEETQRRIDALQAEYDALNKTNPLVKDYGYNVAYAAEQQRLLGEAQKAGVEVTPELQKQIDGLADGYARASANVEQLKTSQQAAAESAQQFGSLAKDFIGGFISDLRNGKSATEALGNALDRLADKLIDMTLNSIFGTGGGAGAGGGGLLGGLFSGLFGGVAEKGGLVGSSSMPRRLANPRHFRGARSYQRGGFPGQPPGSIPIYAHPGELIIPKNMVGGLSRSGTGGSGDTHISNTLGPIGIDMGSTGLVASTTESGKFLGQQIQSAVEVILVRESRPGGILRKQGVM